MNGSSRSIGELADHVAEKDLPLLFLDTCALLDVIRAPFRHDDANETIATISGAMQLADRQDEFVLAVSSIVPGEFRAHFSRVTDELTSHCQSLIDEITAMDALFKSLGLQTHLPIPHNSYRELESRLRQLAKRLLANAFILKPEDSIELKAFRRSKGRIPPGQRRDQDKDCQIFEECLEASRLLRNENHSGRIVFCTSNRRDYCAVRSVPHPEITKELDSVNVTFTTNLPWACAELGL